MSLLGRVIDCSYEEFEESCKNSTLGDLMGIKNLLITTYNQLTVQKNKLIEGVLSGKYQKSEVGLTIKGVYRSMFSIESKVIYLSKLIEERTKVTD